MAMRGAQINSSTMVDTPKEPSEIAIAMPTSVKEIDVTECGPVLPLDTIEKCVMHPPFHTRGLDWFNSNLTKPKKLTTFVKNLEAGLRELDPEFCAQLQPSLGVFLELPPQSVTVIMGAIACASTQPPRLAALLKDHRLLLHTDTNLAFLQLRVLCAITADPCPELCCSKVDTATDTAEATDQRKSEDGWIRRPQDEGEIKRDQAVAKQRRANSRRDSPK